MPLPSKRFQPSRRPPRQQLLQLHAPAICFSGGSRLPFARPQTPQTLPTLPQASKQASKATTLTATATCPCHLFFRGFKTAVCPPSNPPNPPNASNASAGLQAGLQGNNSYSYMPLPSKRFQPSLRPPRQQLLQLHAPAICFSGGSRLPFARPQTPQTLPTLPQASKQASKATTLTATATCPCHLFFRGFKTAVCPSSNPLNASNASAGLQAGLQGNNSYSYMPLPSKRFQPSRRPPRQQLLQLHAPAICFSGGSRLPFARPQTPQTLPTLPQASKQASKATTLTATATCPCHLFDCRLPGLKPPKRFQPFRRPPSRPPKQQLLQLQLHAPAICFSGGSRLPFARPQTPQTLQTLPQASKQASKATTLTATCPCHLFFRRFKTAVCPPSNLPNASNPPAGLQGNNSYSYMPLPSVFKGVQDCRLPALKPPKRFQPSRRPPRQQLLQLHAPAICFSWGSRLPFAWPQTPQTLPTLRRPPRQQLLQLYMPLPSVFQGVQDCRLPGLKPPKRFQPPLRPPKQQLLQLQLHAPAICFSGGSRLPFARPQTPQTLPTLPQASKQASKATTLTATCRRPAKWQTFAPVTSRDLTAGIWTKTAVSQ